MSTDEAFKSKIEKIKAYPIVEYAKVIGFTPHPKGNSKKYYSLREHDSVMINTDENLFWRNQNGVHGDIIDFSMEFEGKKRNEAIKSLADFIGADIPNPYTHEKYHPIKNEKKEPVPFILPQRDLDSREHNVYAYLTKTRKISPSIVNMMIDRGYLYQDTQKNCVFVSYDKKGKPDFASKRGTNTYKRFVADVKGSNYKNCFYFANGGNTLVVTESVIDSMSVMTHMESFGRNLNNYDFLTLSGTQKFHAVKNNLLENPQIKHVVLACDNDIAGLTCIANIQDDLRECGWNGNVTEFIPPNKKDWNEEIVNRRAIKTEQDKHVPCYETDDVDVDV